MNARIGVNSVKLDLLRFSGFGVRRSVLSNFSRTRTDTGVGVVNVVEEYFLGLMSGCCDSVSASQPSRRSFQEDEQSMKDSLQGYVRAYRLKNSPTPSLPNERQYCRSRAWWTQFLAYSGFPSI